jgi:hypothetical protein
MPIRVCFVGLNTYTLFNPTVHYVYGGAEVRSYLFSVGLARDPEFQMSYVVRNYGQPSKETYHNVEVYAHTSYGTAPKMTLVRRLFDDIAQTGGVVQPTGQFPYRRIINFEPKVLAKYGLAQTLKVLDLLIHWQSYASYPRLHIYDYVVPRIRYEIYDIIDADIYAVFGVSNLAGEVAAFCKARGKRFILFLADIINLDQRYKPRAKGTDVYMNSFSVCHYAIEHAHLIVAQLESQRQLLKERFGRPAVIVRNPVEVLAEGESRPFNAPERRIALWIGRADNFKKMPMLLIELALACPDVSFVMVMNSHMPEVEQAVYAAQPGNVVIHEHLPLVAIEELFEQAFAFVSTSVKEGFPNTFLQAGKHGVPVLSYQVDPDDFLERDECGIVAHGRFEDLVRGLRMLQRDSSGCYANNMRRYVKEMHELNGRVCELATVIKALSSDSLERLDIR